MKICKNKIYMMFEYTLHFIYSRVVDSCIDMHYLWPCRTQWCARVSILREDVFLSYYTDVGRLHQEKQRIRPPQELGMMLRDISEIMNLSKPRTVPKTR